jgi:hypothetical protein
MASFIMWPAGTLAGSLAMAGKQLKLSSLFPEASRSTATETSTLPIRTITGFGELVSMESFRPWQETKSADTAGMGDQPHRHRLRNRGLSRLMLEGIFSSPIHTIIAFAWLHQAGSSRPLRVTPKSGPQDFQGTVDPQYRRHSTCHMGWPSIQEATSTLVIRIIGASAALAFRGLSTRSLETGSAILPVTAVRQRRHRWIFLPQ